MDASRTPLRQQIYIYVNTGKAVIERHATTQGSSEGNASKTDGGKKITILLNAKAAAQLDLANEQESEEQYDLGEEDTYVGNGIRDMEEVDQGFGTNTRAMRDKIEREYAQHDSDEVPDSQPDEKGRLWQR